MMVHGHLRIPLDKCLLHISRFFLREGERVAIEVKSIMVDAAPYRPRLAMLNSVSIGVANRNGIVPGGKSLVSVRIFAGQYENDGILQNIHRRRLVGCGELIDDLHKCLERRRFVAVDGVCHPGDRRITSGDGVSVGRRDLSRIGETSICGLDIVEACKIFGRRNCDQMLHSMFARSSDVKDLYPFRGCLGDRVDHLLHLGISRVMVTDIVP